MGFVGTDIMPGPEQRARAFRPPHKSALDLPDMREGGGDPARLAALDLRFAGVVYPGDRLDFACWRDGVRVLFEARVGERVVLDQGVAMLG